MKEFKALLEELNTTNSSNEKKEILKKYPESSNLLWWTLNPFKKFHITSANLKKRNDLILPEDSDSPDIFELLRLLSNEEVTGHSAIKMVNTFIRNNKEYEDIIYRIIDKDLKVRVDAKLINKVWPGFIPEFEVSLAKKYEDYENKVDFTTQDWFAARKLDGVRVICVIGENGDINFWSRKGKEIDTLDNIKKSLEKYDLKETVLDGELCLVDKEGNEDFSSVMKEIRKKDHIIENPKYKVFDILTLENFTNKKSKDTLSQRFQKLQELKLDKDDYIDIIEQRKIEDKEHLMFIMKEAVDKGWEGLIVRKDVPYEGKRTNDMLKVKKFFDAEYTIKNVLMDSIRFIEDGKDVEEEMLSSVVIEHKGYDVKVGSGFSINERRYYYKHPDELIGNEITVVYFEETTNKQGTISLRFPTVKAIHGKAREV